MAVPIFHSPEMQAAIAKAVVAEVKRRNMSECPACGLPITKDEKHRCPMHEFMDMRRQMKGGRES